MEDICGFRYRSIYTSDGLTLHELALKLQDGLSSNVNIDELPTLTSGNLMDLLVFCLFHPSGNVPLCFSYLKFFILRVIAIITISVELFNRFFVNIWACMY